MTWVTQFSFRSGLLLLRLWALWATRSVVHKPTASSFGLSQAIATMPDHAKHDRAIVDGIAAGISVLDEAHRLADQRPADVDRIAVPLDLAVLTHAPDSLVGLIARLAQDTIEAAWRDGVMLGRRIVAERLMRTVFVVDVLEHAQALKLLAQAAGRRFGGVLQQGQMHSLMPAILLRLAGGDPFRQHTGLDHLDRQLRQSAGTARGKGRTVVGAQPMRKAELAKGRFQHRPDVSGIGAR